MLRYILDGGPLMWAILLESVIALAIVFDRLKAFKSASRDTSAMRRMILQLVGAGKIDDAIRLCEETRGPVAAILLVGLERYRRLLDLGCTLSEIKESVSESMRDYAPHVADALEKRVNILLAIASTAPLLGMTGTVTGMIKAFGAMAGAEMLSGGVVAAGISEALITTAAGLIVAVPTVLAYNLLSNKVEQYTLALEDAATELVDYIYVNGLASRAA